MAHVLCSSAFGIPTARFDQGGGQGPADDHDTGLSEEKAHVPCGTESGIPAAQFDRGGGQGPSESQRSGGHRSDLRTKDVSGNNCGVNSTDTASTEPEVARIQERMMHEHGGSGRICYCARTELSHTITVRNGTFADRKDF